MSTFGKSISTRITIEGVLRCSTCVRTIDDRIRVDVTEGEEADMSECVAALFTNLSKQAEQRGWIEGSSAVVCGRCRDK